MPSLKAMAKEAKNKKSVAPKKGTKGVTSPAANLSTEFVQDSDIEDDEISDKTSSSDDEESLPENPIVVTPKSNWKAAAPVADRSSSSGSESESAEDSSSEEDEDGDPSKTTKKVSIASELEKSQSSKASTMRTVSFKEPTPYIPPAGFETASIDEPSQAQILTKHALEGKHIWYITAPTSVPISSIHKTSLAKIRQGSKVLSHGGNDYGFIQDSSEDITNIKLLMPSSTDDSYRAATKSIDRILHLQQIVQLPSVYDANAEEAPSSITARSTVPAKKLVRQQPPGLKMRFRPIGFGTGKTGTIGSSSSSADESSAESASDEEIDDALPQFQRPASMESSTSSDISDSSSLTSDVEMTDAPPAPSKLAVTAKPEKSSHVPYQALKRKHSEGEDMRVKNSSSSSENPTNRALKEVKKKQKISRAGNQLVLTEAHKTTSSKPPHPVPTLRTPVPPPISKRDRLPLSQNISSPAKATPIRPASSTQTSPACNSQSLIAPSGSRNTSGSPSKELHVEKRLDAIDLDASEEERGRDAKRSKSDKSQKSTIRNRKNKISSDEVQDLPDKATNSKEKRNSKDSKNEKKSWEEARMENERGKDLMPKVYSSPILPPIRSKSILPPT